MSQDDDDKAALRREVAQDVRAFLKRGGRIRRTPTGVSSEAARNGLAHRQLTISPSKPTKRR